MTSTTTIRAAALAALLAAAIAAVLVLRPDAAATATAAADKDPAAPRLSGRPAASQMAALGRPSTAPVPAAAAAALARVGNDAPEDLHPGAPDGAGPRALVADLAGTAVYGQRTAKGYACRSLRLANGHSSTGCLAAFEQGRDLTMAFTKSDPDSPVVVDGFASDAVTAVTVVTSDGRSEAALANNAWLWTAPNATTLPVAVEATLADGTVDSHDVDVSVPVG